MEAGRLRRMTRMHTNDKITLKLRQEPVRPALSQAVARKAGRTMRHHFRVFAWVVVLASIGVRFLTSAAHGQGTAFTYQGMLQAGGNPASGIYDVRFTACDALTNGNVLGGPVTNAAVPVTNGLFTTTVDFGPGVFTGAAVWLQTDVRTNGAATFTLLSPRQPVTAAPYAVMAGGAGNVAGLSNAIVGWVGSNFVTSAEATNVASTVMNANSAGYLTASQVDNIVNAMTNGLISASGAAAQFYPLSNPNGYQTAPTNVIDSYGGDLVIATTNTAYTNFNGTYRFITFSNTGVGGATYYGPMFNNSPFGYGILTYAEFTNNSNPNAYLKFSINMLFGIWSLSTNSVFVANAQLDTCVFPAQQAWLGSNNCYNETYYYPAPIGQWEISSNYNGTTLPYPAPPTNALVGAICTCTVTNFTAVPPLIDSPHGARLHRLGFLGDSIFHGVGGGNKNAQCNVLIPKFGAMLVPTIYRNLLNAGLVQPCTSVPFVDGALPGATTATWTNSAVLFPFLSSCQSNGVTDVLICLGPNDAGSAKFPVGVFTNSLQVIASNVVSRGMTALLCGPELVPPGNYGNSFSTFAPLLTNYFNALPALDNNNNIRIADNRVFLLTSANGTNFLYTDLHPTALGAQQWGELISEGCKRVWQASVPNDAAGQLLLQTNTIP